MLVGADHIKMTVRQPDSAAFDCIAFGQGMWADKLKAGKPFDICYTIEENVWRDKRSIQLNVKGIRVK
jgi:single-stranded-DNA-specific exonuclease